MFMLELMLPPTPTPAPIPIRFSLNSFFTTIFVGITLTVILCPKPLLIVKNLEPFVSSKKKYKQLHTTLFESYRENRQHTHHQRSLQTPLPFLVKI